MNTIEEAVADFRDGRMLIVVDDEGRENEGDLIVAARHATAEAIGFMAMHGRGLICVAVEQERLTALGIGQMVKENTDAHGTAFAVSVDHAETSTGISAADRALTIRSLADPSASSRDFRKPGHVFPLAARTGGVLARRGHTEAACDLSRLAFGEDGTAIHAGAICEIMNDDGTMARRDALESFARVHGLKMITVESLADFRAASALTTKAAPHNDVVPRKDAAPHEGAVKLIASARLPTRYGEFRLYGYLETATGAEHVALVMGELSGDDAILCRVHSECLTGDTLGSSRCDCGEQYDAAMRLIAREGRGALVYLRQEGRGIGLLNKIRAYALQDSGADTIDANVALGFSPDEREYSAAAAILANLGVHSVRLMTNNPDKAVGLEALGVSVTCRVPLVIQPNRDNAFYLETKERRMGHSLGLARDEKKSETRSYHENF